MAEPSPSSQNESDSVVSSSVLRQRVLEQAAATLSLSTILPYINNSTPLRESAARRRLELRLMHNFTECFMKPFPDHRGAHKVTGWATEVPRMAFQHENLMCSLFASSATYLLQTNPEDVELFRAAEVYLALALRSQQQALANVETENADAICFTGVLLLLNSTAKMAWRPIEPYTPPLEFLQIGIGFQSVLAIAKDFYKSSKVMMITTNSEPDFEKEPVFAKHNLLPFLNLLDAGPSTVDELTERETREAYEQTVSYIGYLHRSITENDPIYVISRKIISFAIFVPKGFVQCVEEKSPRALVVLAYYFALMSRVRSIWWIGRMPLREITAIMNVLPQEWHEEMRWPLTMAGLDLDRSNFPRS
ncbi:hypothetical protein LTR10_015225 [Elasticomyces elasticus]|uniref:Transcription factor domain-containing protein n=1 Tax=Exophiala sideris TaxID=1016849 RepID=A0ABR0JG96_9EURO|nr:hypothetical protein LTR10_015225 [Elasticomyces elasticus]KAK5032700.1 hypothetical protein LTS07_004110 [Exophiala sideris]KAK5037120.1 hypothetical protein LTR13_004925 [Exophiala sideris]KAK5062224.1 hypothetical protein LTR69_004582 [Exophiala sideris]KAK5182278.1 hypothetical protein LTR44_005289 [Eurotiomycetes sp. CCFEE 6388]